MMITKRTIVTVFVVLALIIGVAIGVSRLIKHINSTHTVSVELANIRSGVVKTTSSDDHKDADTEEVRKFDSKGFSVRLNKSTAYTVEYKATDGYQDGSRTIQPGEKNIHISPEYSTARQKAIIADATEQFKNTITEATPKLGELYNIDMDKGRLLNHGEWFIVTLTYKGAYTDKMSDTLVVGLQKKDNDWKIGFRPSLITTKAYTPNVPHDIMLEANTLRQERAFELLNAQKAALN